MVHLVQCLCPQRHCVFGIAYDDATGMTPDDAITQLKEYRVELQMDKCGICDSADFNYEDRITPWKTMEEAKGPLADAQAAQLLTRARIELQKIAENN